MNQLIKFVKHRFDRLFLEWSTLRYGIQSRFQKSQILDNLLPIGSKAENNYFRITKFLGEEDVLNQTENVSGSGFNGSTNSKIVFEEKSNSQNKLNFLKQFYDQSNIRLELPIYNVDTRDCFIYDPIIKISKFPKSQNNNYPQICSSDDSKNEQSEEESGLIQKNEFIFEEEKLPSNFQYFKKLFPDFRTGVVTYENVFSDSEIKELEDFASLTEHQYLQGQFLPLTGQTTLKGNQIKRTKFFFGARYMWSAVQLSEPHSNIASGIRTDVTDIPDWIKNKLIDKLENCGVIPKVRSSLLLFSYLI